MNAPVVLAIGPYADWDVEALKDAFEVQFLDHLSALAQIPGEQRARVQALAYLGHDPLGSEQLQLLPELRLIANFGVGYDAIDIDAAHARGVQVSNTPDVLNDDVADTALALVLMTSRNLVQGDAHIRAGGWSQSYLPLAHRVTGKRAGILGLGRIGREIADRLAAFKMELHYYSRREKPVPEDWRYHGDPVALAEAVDFLIIATVGGRETAGLVSAEVIQALGPDGILVNISRGSTVDEAALLDALENGGLRGAGLDVFLNEPDIDPRFRTLPNVVLQPHVGSATIDTRKAMGALQRQNIAAVLAGNPLVTPVT